jgi:Flp pilus assembly protein TadG
MILAICKSLRRITRRLRREDDGVSAIEFAMVGGPFFFLMMVTFEASLAFVTEYSLQSATTTAGRLIRTGQVQENGLSKDAFKTELCNNLAGYIDCGKVYVNVEVRDSFSNASNRTNATSDGELSDPGDGAFDPGVAEQIVVVEAFYVWELFTPGFMALLNLSGNSVETPHFLANLGDDKRLVRGVAVFRNEPFN